MKAMKDSVIGRIAGIVIMEGALGRLLLQLLLFHLTNEAVFTMLCAFLSGVSLLTAALLLVICPRCARTVLWVAVLFSVYTVSFVVYQVGGWVLCSVFDGYTAPLLCDYLLLALMDSGVHALLQTVLNSFAAVFLLVMLWDKLHAVHLDCRMRTARLWWLPGTAVGAGYLGYIVKIACAVRGAGYFELRLYLWILLFLLAEIAGWLLLGYWAAHSAVVTAAKTTDVWYNAAAQKTEK